MRKGDPARDGLHGLLDLLGTSFRLGAQVGVSYGESYQQLLANHDFASRVFFNPSRGNLWHMIDKGRLDGIIADENSGLYELEQLGLNERIGPTAVVVSSDAAEVAFSKRTTTPAFVERYARAMRELVEGGEYQAILQRYLSPCRSAPCARFRGQGPLLQVRHGSPPPVGADLVRDSRRYRRGSRIRFAPTLPHPHHSPVGARPARESRAGPAPTGQAR